MRVLNSRDADGNTALHVAVASGQFDATRVLLDFGADPNADNDCGETPLHVAAFGGQLHVTQALLKGGADGARRTTGGETARAIAIRRRKRGAAALLDG
jgi:ankyrin repeat protein